MNSLNTAPVSACCISLKLIYTHTVYAVYRRKNSAPLIIRRSHNEIISKLNQNYGKVETNNKKESSPFFGKSKLEIMLFAC